MEVLAIVLIKLLVICFSGWVYRRLRVERIKRESERNGAVYWFRRYIHVKHPELYDQLPSYKSMLNGSEPVGMKSYFPDHPEARI